MAAPAIDASKKWDLRNADLRRTVDSYYALKDGEVQEVCREGAASGK